MKPSSGTLSVVIITKNEEKWIESCINSVMEATPEISNEVEIILVDSYSQDRTLEIGKKFPIKILQLKPEWFHSPGAGRYIGFLNSHGTYVQFLDGDMTLEKNWLPRALKFLEENSEEIAGISGKITSGKTKSLMLRKFHEDLEFNHSNKARKVRSIYGASLLRSSVLEKIGSFDPYLISVEEGELSDRFLSQGYSLMMLPLPMAHHHVEGHSTLFNDLKKKINFMIGEGQVLRRAFFNSKIFLERARHHKFYFLFPILSLFFLISLLHKPSWMFTSLSLFLILFLWILLVERKNLFYSLLRFFSSLALWPFFVYGFLKSIKNPKSYPQNPKRIK